MTDNQTKELLEQLKAGGNVRKTLIAIRSSLSGEEAGAAKEILRQEIGLFEELLKDDDPKVRKNAALILGEMETEEVLPFLFDAYQKEETLFVRADYLKAASGSDCRQYLPMLKEQERKLENTPAAENEIKHIAAEKKALRELIWQLEKPACHRFRCPDGKVDVILLANRSLRDLTISQVSAASVRGLGAGARFHGADLRQVLPIRTYTELLFPIPSLPRIPRDPVKAGQMLAGAHLPAFLNTMHDEAGPYRYRVEVRGEKMDGNDIRSLTGALEKEEPGMINSVSDYEVEIRLLGLKEGGFVPCLKLYTIPDERFAYRKGAAADSIAPANAAAIVRYALPHMKEGARVWDPFCGVGTMLIERQMALGAGEMFGTDTFGDAIRMGRENAQCAGVNIHFVNRDFASFTCERPFDEIITDMPASQTDPLTGEKTSPEELYRLFFAKIPSMVVDGALLVLYTPCPKAAGAILEQERAFEMIGQTIFNERTGTKILLVRYHVRS